MSNWFSGDVNGIHYTRTGGDKPPLVLAHGFTDHGLCWTPVAQVLESDYDVIMVDARGHGLSDGPYAGYDYAEDLVGLIQALGLRQPAVMGHSMGAYTTAIAAALHPELFGRIILEDPPYFADAEPMHISEQPDGEPAWLIRLFGKTHEELIAIARQDNPNWSDAEIGPWAESKMQFNRDVLKVAPASDPAPWPEIISRIQCPALLITGDVERGALISPEIAQRIIDLLPHGELAHIEGAGHCIRRDRFEPFMQAVKAFLAG